MYDQSFSADNYLRIFQEENRKGNIAFDDMPEPYKNIVADMKAQQSEVVEITKKKKINRTDDDLARLEELKSSIKNLRFDRDKELYEELIE